jgi:hypothetical protein
MSASEGNGDKSAGIPDLGVHALELQIIFKEAIAFGEAFLDSGCQSQSADARKF